VLRSAAHGEGGTVDVGGATVGDGTSGLLKDPDTVSDGQIGPHPPGYEQGTGNSRSKDKKIWKGNVQLNNT
jgi:hypothetical protein